MKKSTVRWIALIAGICLLLLGCALFATPVLNSVAVAYVAVALMLIHGVTEICHYFTSRKEQGLSGWSLADGIITTVLALMLLFQPGAEMFMISYIFAFWVLFTGVTRTSAAFTLRDIGGKRWGWVLAAGIIGILLGVLALFNPLYGILVIGFMLPMLFIIQGISAVAVFFASGDDKE